MRVAIIGAGAIGTWLGVRLAKAGCQVSVLARERTLAAIKERGMQLAIGGTTHVATVHASDRAADLGIQDLVVLSVKGHALPSVAPAIAPLLNSATTVLTAMNGVPWWFFHGRPGPLQDASLQSVDPGLVVSKAIPPARVLGCVVHAACTTTEPGCSVHKNGNGLIVGEPQGGTSGRLDAVVEILRRAEFEATASQNIQRDIWYKLWGNMTMNPISALTGATSDQILDDPLVSAFVLSVMAEASELGANIGCHIAQSGVERMQVTRKLGSFKTSMLQDVEAGRVLELDALLAAPREIARMLDMATPNMDALHGLTRLFARVRGLA